MRRKESRIVGESKVAEAITVMLNTTMKSQFEVAREMGLSRGSNIMTMFKQGRTRLPFERIPSLARACGVSPAPLLTLALSEYAPELVRTLESVYGIDLADLTNRAGREEG